MLPAEANTLDKVAYREKILAAQAQMMGLIADGETPDTLSECVLTHTYTPVHEEYGCGTYARQMFIPKGTVLIGKIHRHPCLNFVMQGRIVVTTEDGPKLITAPCHFVSEAGVKRAGYAEEDTIWVTVHMTKFTGEENLDRMEDELIAPTFEDMGLVASVEALQRIAS